MQCSRPGRGRCTWTGNVDDDAWPTQQFLHKKNAIPVMKWALHRSCKPERSHAPASCLNGACADGTCLPYTLVKSTARRSGAQPSQPIFLMTRTKTALSPAFLQHALLCCRKKKCHPHRQTCKRTHVPCQFPETPNCARPSGEASALPVEHAQYVKVFLAENAYFS